MYDVKVLHLLDKVIESLEVIQQRTENIHCTMIFWILLQELYYWMEFV